MRYVILDTETTGLSPAQGHRVVEIGLVEVNGRQRSGRHYHQYLNPDRDSDPGALQKHGLSREFLADKPRFDEVAEDFLGFLDQATLIIHNAPFDLGFLDHELTRLGRPALSGRFKVIDTLAEARELHPGKRNNLDALCERYGIDHSHRDFHGALLDAELLSEVYLAMTRGQEDLLIPDREIIDPRWAAAHPEGSRTPPRVIEPSTEELEAHRLQLDTIDRVSGGHCLWKITG